MRLFRALLLVPVILLGSCSKENNISTGGAGGEVGQQCSGSDDEGCGEGAVCALGYCRHGCTNDVECPQGAICVGDRPPYGCTTPDEGACEGDGDCAAGLICGVDHVCRHACEVQEDCPRNEHRCVAGTCVSTGEGDLQKWGCDIEGYGDCDPRMRYDELYGQTTVFNGVAAGTVVVDSCDRGVFADVKMGVPADERRGFYSDPPVYACPDAACPSGRYFCSAEALSACAGEPECAACMFESAYEPPFECRPSTTRVLELCDCIGENPCEPPPASCQGCEQDPAYILSRPFSGCEVALPDGVLFESNDASWGLDRNAIEVFSRDRAIAANEYTVENGRLVVSEPACSAADLTVMMCQTKLKCVVGTDTSACQDPLVE